MELYKLGENVKIFIFVVCVYEFLAKTFVSFYSSYFPINMTHNRV